MSESTPEKPQPITPYLLYEDAGGALAWLARVFGFCEREAETMRNDDGRVVHASMEIGGGVILLGHPGADYRCPRQTGHVASNLYVYVDDVEPHFRAAEREGADIIEPLQDTFYGDRRYGAADIEGHHWYFAQKVRETTPEEWQPSREDLKGHG